MNYSMDTQHQIDRLIELAIIQRTELRQLVDQLPQLREHLAAEVEQVFEQAEPQMRAELEEFCSQQATDATAKTGSALESKISELAANLERTTQARYNAIIAEREENVRLTAQAEQKIAEHAASLPGAVKEIVTAELARFPRAGEIDQLRKEFAEPRGLNPRGKWQAGETYNKLDLVTINGDSFVSNSDGNRERPSRSAAEWTLSAARGQGGGGGITSLNDVLNTPTSGQIIGSQGGQYVPKTLVAGANITINETASTITIIGDEGEISLQDGTAAAPSLFFTNDTDTGLYRPAANTLGISVSGTQIAYFDEDGLTVTNAGATLGGSLHAANGNANNPSLSFDSDQDTGFFRHQPNELGITLGGTQKATLTSTTFTITPNLVVSGTGTINGTSIPASKTLVVTTDKISALAATTSSELAGVISDETGSGSLVFATSPTLVTPILGTPQSGTLTSCTGLPISTGVSGLGTNVATFLATPSSANLAAAVTDETGSGALVFANTPTLVTPNIGAATGSSLNLSGNATVGGNLTVSGGTQVLSASGGSDSLLVVEQTGTAAAYLRLQSAAAASGAFGGIEFKDAGSARWFIGGNGGYVNAAHDFNVTVNGDYRFRIDTAGVSRVLSTTASSSTSTGALVVSGGVGVAKRVTTGERILANASVSAAAATISTGATLYAGQIDNVGYGTKLLFDHSFGTPESQTRGAFVQSRVDVYGFSTDVGLGFGTTSGGSISEKMFLASGGNLLLGTTTNSANGKLQLTTHTTSAGGIGFGTDTSLYRAGTGVLQLDGSNVARLTMKDVAAGLANYIASDGGNLFIGVTDTPSPANDAIVLDPSKNVTFAGSATLAGNLTMSGGSGTTLSLQHSPSYGQAISKTISIGGTNVGYVNNGATAYWDLNVANADVYGADFKVKRYVQGTGLADVLTLSSAGNTTLSGNLTVSGSESSLTNSSPAPENAASAPGSFKFTGAGWNTFTGSQAIAVRLNPIFLYWTAAGSNSPFGQTYPDLAFDFLNSDASGTYSEKVRITGSGNLLIGGTTNITGGGGLKVFGTTAASSTTTGALQVAGGVGIAGAAYVGGNLNVSGTQNVFGLPSSASALGTNSTMTFERTSNTSLTIKVRGSDGTTRSVSLTLA